MLFGPRDTLKSEERKKETRKRAKKERKWIIQGREGRTARRHHTGILRKKERKKTDNPREGWEDGTPPPHRDFKERSVMR